MRFFASLLIIALLSLGMESVALAYPIYKKQQIVQTEKKLCTIISSEPVVIVKPKDFRFIKSRSSRVYIDGNWLLKSLKKRREFSRRKTDPIKLSVSRTKSVCDRYRTRVAVTTPTPIVTPMVTSTPVPTATQTFTPSPTPTATSTPAWLVSQTLSMRTNWKLGQAVTIYAYSPGGNAGINLSPRLAFNGPDDHFLIRVFTPDRNLVFSERFTATNAGTIAINNNIDLSFIPLPQEGVWSIRVNSEIKNLRLNLLRTQGVELYVSYGNGKFEPWQVNGAELVETYLPIGQHPGLNTEISVQSSEGNIVSVSKVECSTNSLHSSAVSINSTSTTSTIRLLRGSGNGVLRILSQPGAKLSVVGTPSIFAATCDGAAKIGTRRMRVPAGPYSGMVVYHKFQLEIAELVPQLFSYMGSTSDILNRADVSGILNSAACRSPSADIDVYKNYSLVYPYDGTLLAAYWALLTDPETGIPNQILDPSSHFYGAIGASQYKRQFCSTNYDLVNRDAVCVGGRSDRNFDPLKDRWDAYRSVSYESTGGTGRDTFYAGISPNSTAAYALGFAATTRTACNPFGPHGNGSLAFPELAARSVLGSLAELLALPEHGIWFGIDADNETYEGIPAFTTFKHFSNFRSMSPYLEEIFGEAKGREIRRIWGDALRHFVDRIYTDKIVNFRNQSAHYLLGLYEFAEGAEQLPYGSRYREWANRWADRFFASQDPTGYYAENSGPDAQYIGMTTAMIARYYNLSKRKIADWRALDSLEQVYGFFGHTVAPDSGVANGSSDFAHRVAWSFTEKFWGWDDTLRSELPVIASYPLKSKASVSQIRSWLSLQTAEFTTRALSVHKVNRQHTAATFEDFEASDLNATSLLPAQSATSFARLFGDEMFSVKRPSYFTTIYFGRSNPDGIAIPPSARLPSALENRPPSAWTSRSPSEDPENVALAPVVTNNGGGISVLHTPSFGAAILSQSWSPLTSNGLIATVSGQRYWPNYSSISHTEVLTGTPQLTVNGTIAEAGIQYARTYRFYDYYIEVTLALSKIVGSSSSPSTLIENLPILTCTRAECGSDANVKKRGSRLLKIDGSALLSGSHVNGIQVRDFQNNRVRFDFLSASPLVTVMEHGLRYNYWNQIEYQVGSVQVALPIPNGTATSFVYRIYPN